MIRLRNNLVLFGDFKSFQLLFLFTVLFSLYLPTCSTQSLLNRTKETCNNEEIKMFYNDPSRRKTSKNFKFLISETNIHTPNLAEEEIFVEIKTDATKIKAGKAASHVLANHMLVLITSSPLQIQLVVDFNHQNVVIGPQNLFVVIGSGENSNVNFNSAAVKLAYPQNSIWSKCSRFACALVLLENPYKRELNELHLLKNIINQYQPLNIENEIRQQSIILKSAVDVLIFGSINVMLRSAFFDKILTANGKTGQKYLLRQVSQQTKINFPSLNYCSSTFETFKVYDFEQGRSSPGTANICNGAFILTQNIVSRATNIELHNTNTPLKPTSTLLEPKSTLFVPYQLEPSSTETPYEIFSVEETLALPDLSTGVTSTLHFEISATPTLETPTTQLTTSAVAVPPQETEVEIWRNPYVSPEFNENWIAQCKNQLPSQGRQLHYSFTRSWLQVNRVNGVCKFSCHICKQYYSLGFRPDIKNKKNIVKQEGFNSASPSRNEDEIKKHPSDTIHAKAAQMFHKLKSAKTKYEYDKILETEIKDQLTIFKPTMTILKTVYTMIKGNIPFRQLPRLADLLKDSDIVLGNFQQNDVAAQKITASISLSFRKKLLQHLVDQNKGFTLLADESTDRGSISLLIVYFQTLEDGRPMTYFYGLIELDEGQSALKTFSKLKNRVLQDDVLVPGFEMFFKTNIVLFVSDSAASMVGQYNSVHSKINEYISPRTISVVKCFAHKLELIMEWSLKRKADSDTRFRYLNTFSAQINKFYSFFMSRGSKRWLHLQEIGQELSERPKRLKYVYQTRWADSRYRSLLSLDENYNLLKPALISIDQYDESFNDDAQDQARNLYNILQDQSFSVCLREVLDFLTIYRTLSLHFQKSASILVGKADIVEQAYQDIEKLKTTPGGHVTKFLSECSCKNGCSAPTCTLDEYDDCQEVIHNGYSLEKVEINRILLSRVRHELYTSMTKELDQYLNLEILVAVQLFDNKKMIFSSAKPVIHPGDTIKPMGQYYDIHYEFFQHQSVSHKMAIVCEFYHIEESTCGQLGREWRVLVHHVVGNDFLWDYRNEPADVFWPLAISQTVLPWTRLTKLIVEYTLVSGNNDAISERGFSILDFTKSKSRSRLSPKTVEDIINIRENGPDSIEEVSFFEYTIDFLKTHYRSDHEWNLGGRPLKDENFHSFLRKSRLF